MIPLFVSGVLSLLGALDSFFLVGVFCPFDEEKEDEDEDKAVEEEEDDEEEGEEEVDFPLV